VATYSRGMRQRLGIARALVNAPRLVFLDEPTLGLDPAGQRDLLDIVRRVARERGTSVILSTHLLQEADELCDKVAIMHRGRIIKQGTTTEVRGGARDVTRARISVSPEAHDEAVRILRATGEVEDVTTIEARRGAFQVAFRADGREGRLSGTRTFIALQDGGVRVLEFDAQPRRLNDAFLELTQEASA
ncbi:MAG: AAA family ATPase, partial [Thermoplasmatota archaeon]